VPVAGGTVEELLGPGYSVTPFPQAPTTASAGRWPRRAPQRVVEEVDQRCTDRARGFPWCATLVVEVDTAVGRTLLAHHEPSWQFGDEYEREQLAPAAAHLFERLTGGADHVVVLGDLDATPDAARQSLAGLSVCHQDARETLHPTDPGHTVDAQPAGAGRRGGDGGGPAHRLRARPQRGPRTDASGDVLRPRARRAGRRRPGWRPRRRRRRPRPPGPPAEI
jgi:hypothetical protein